MEVRFNVCANLEGVVGRKKRISWKKTVCERFLKDRQ